MYSNHGSSPQRPPLVYWTETPNGNTITKEICLLTVGSKHLTMTLLGKKDKAEWVTERTTLCTTLFSTTEMTAATNT